MARSAPWTWNLNPVASSPASTTRAIGSRTRRIDGQAKVSGEAKFTADLAVPNQAYAALLLSPHASAELRSIEVGRALECPGVLTVITGGDLRASYSSAPDAPLAIDRIYFAGQPIAAVAAETFSAALDAIQLIDVDYTVLQPMLEISDAMHPDAPVVLKGVKSSFDDAGAHGLIASDENMAGQGSNVVARSVFRKGNLEDTFASSAHVVSGVYDVPFVQHAAIEPHVVVVVPEPDRRLTVYAPTQGAFLTRRMLAARLNLPESRINVVPMPVGGGFGGKVLLLEPVAAILAQRLGRPIRLELSRTEEFLMGGASPGARVELKLGADRNGHLQALQSRVIFDNGAAMGGTLVGLAGVLLGGVYRIPGYDIEAIQVVTNRCPTTAYRAPGAAQLMFALESAISELAQSVGLDPIEMRLVNASREGDPRPDGRNWPRTGLRECLLFAQRHPIYTEPAVINEGVGVAVGAWLGGCEPAQAHCRVEADGSVRLHVGSVDITGSYTAFASIVADTLGVPIERVDVRISSTDTAPYAGMAGGSKMIYSVGPAVQRAAAETRQRLLDIAAAKLEVSKHDLQIEDGRVAVRGVPSRSLSIGELAAAAMQFGAPFESVHGWGSVAMSQPDPMFTVHIARVVTDQETGEWRVSKYAAIQDVGHALNPASIEGQVHGGALQSMARALGECLSWDRDGTLRTATFGDYAIPTIDQAPQTEVSLIEIPSVDGPFGAKGVGEPPAVPGAAAIANAVMAATGRTARRVPIEWETLVDESGNAQPGASLGSK